MVTHLHIGGKPFLLSPESLISPSGRLCRTGLPCAGAAALPTDADRHCNGFPTQTEVTNRQSPSLWRPLVLLIPLRLGLTDINEAYVETLKVGDSSFLPSVSLATLSMVRQLWGTVNNWLTMRLGVTCGVFSVEVGRKGVDLASGVENSDFSHFVKRPSGSQLAPGICLLLPSGLSVHLESGQGLK